MIFLEQQQEFGDKLLRKFHSQEQFRMQKAQKGDPSFLLAELERAAKALSEDATRQRADTGVSSKSGGSTKGPYNTSIQ